MMALVHDYWPLAVVLAVAVLALWGIDVLAWNRGFDAGRSDTIRQLDKARKANRL